MPTRLFNSSMMYHITATLICGLVVVCGANEGNEDFFEIDVRIIESKEPVQFGAQIYTNAHDKYPALLNKLGSVFQWVYWSTVWHVSGVAAAPRKSSDKNMDMWVTDLYWNIPTDIEPMELTSKMLVNNSIKLLAASGSPPNSYYATPNQIIKRRERIKLEEEGKKVVEEEWTLEKARLDKENETEDDKFVQLIPEFVPDFAKFWASSLEYLQALELTLPFIELTWEPDSKRGTIVYPQDYAATVKQTREQIRLRNIADDKNKIVGPGTSKPSAAKPYIEALVQDREAYDALYAWSFHVWDEGKSMEGIEDELDAFNRMVQTVVPASWPKKPTIVSSFGFSSKSFPIYDDVNFNGNMESCYQNLQGLKQRFEDDLTDTMGQSPVVAVRLLTSLILQYSYGFNQVIYEELHDHPWSHACKGMFDRLDRHKQIYTAFSIFLPFLSKDSIVIRKQWKNSGNCYTAVFKSENALVVSVANPAKTSCTRSFSLSGLEIEKISEAFTVSYNNGTVSLAASNPSEALVLKLPLSYDLFPSEINPEENVIEFDMVVGPNAAATAIFNLLANATDSTAQASIEETFESEVIRSEL